MATRKGICPYCNIPKIENRIFLVNPEAAVCFCPNCMKEMEPSLAINSYDSYLKKLLNIADESLYIKCDPALAYQDYGAIIEIDDTMTDSYLGRLLCMAYMSKVRSNYLNEARILLSDEVNEHFLKASELPKFIPFLKKMNRVLDDYEYVLTRRLSYRGLYFYDIACLSLYLKRLQEIYLFKSDLLKYSMVIRRKYGDENIEVLINLLEHSLDNMEAIKQKDFSLTSGVFFRLEKYNKNGEAVVVKSDKTNKSLNVFKRIRFYSLDPNDKNKRTINDVVFKNYTKVIKAAHRAIFWYIFFYLLTLGSGAAIYFFHSDKMIFIISIALGGLFFTVGTILLLLRLSWKKIIKKRRLAIDQ